MPNAVITGATKGIGKAIAEKLLEEGFDVAVCSRTSSDLKQIKELWSVRFPERKIYVKATDLAKKNEIQDFAYFVQESFEQIDILVNNAGLFFPGSIAQEPQGQMETIMNINFFSAYHLTRYLLPSINSSKMGYIFNMCSVASLKAYSNGGAYSISKYALLGFSDNLRWELRNSGIRVSAICPGAVWTNSWSESGLPRERFIASEDIASTLWSAYNLSGSATAERIVIRPTQGDI